MPLATIDMSAQNAAAVVIATSQNGIVPATWRAIRPVASRATPRRTERRSPIASRNAEPRIDPSAGIPTATADADAYPASSKPSNTSGKNTRRAWSETAHTTARSATPTEELWGSRRGTVTREQVSSAETCSPATLVRWLDGRTLTARLSAALMLAAVPLFVSLLPSPMTTGAVVAGSAVIPVPAPHRALEREQRQEEQREEEEEREEAEPMTADVADDLDTLAGPFQPLP